MSSPHTFVDIPAPRHPLRWVLLALGAITLLIATAGPAAAHAEHSPLPEGFEARITGVTDAAGSPASPGAQFTMAADGARVSVTYTGADELVIYGEQAAEPLVRITGGVAAVNAASPQAVQVEGATTDPAAAAELMDLVWERVPPAWEPLTADTVAFMDHRAVPGHPPVRGDFEEGDVAAGWSIPFTIGGTDYNLTGEVVAVAVPGSGADAGLIVVVVGVLFALAIAVFTLKGWRAIVRRPEAALEPTPDGDPEKDPQPAADLVSAR